MRATDSAVRRNRSQLTLSKKDPGLQYSCRASQKSFRKVSAIKRTKLPVEKCVLTLPVFP